MQEKEIFRIRGNDMESVMNQENSFNYKYSAVENKEIEEIRKKYLPAAESKMDELKCLDAQVQNSGIASALCIGVVGSLIFGLGLCFAMHVLGSGILTMLLGIFLGIIGVFVMLMAYPVYRKKQQKMKEYLTPRILELSNEILGANMQTDNNEKG